MGDQEGRAVLRLIRFGNPRGFPFLLGASMLLFQIDGYLQLWADQVGFVWLAMPSWLWLVVVLLLAVRLVRSGVLLLKRFRGVR